MKNKLFMTFLKDFFFWKINEKNLSKKYSNLKENSQNRSLYNLIKTRLRKSENGCLKTVKYRLLMKQYVFMFLVCDFHKELIELSGFETLYLKNYFNFFKL